MSKLKQIHELLIEIVKLLETKSKAEPESEHVEGQRYEAQYLLARIEEIIYSDND